jgi:hypothetical protein
VPGAVLVLWRRVEVESGDNFVDLVSCVNVVHVETAWCLDDCGLVCKCGMLDEDRRGGRGVVEGGGFTASSAVLVQKSETLQRASINHREFLTRAYY